jgi:hypothetical protein
VRYNRTAQAEVQQLPGNVQLPTATPRWCTAAAHTCVCMPRPRVRPVVQPQLPPRYRCGPVRCCRRHRYPPTGQTDYCIDNRVQRHSPPRLPGVHPIQPAMRMQPRCGARPSQDSMRPHAAALPNPTQRLCQGPSRRGHASPPRGLPIVPPAQLSAAPALSSRSARLSRLSPPPELLLPSSPSPCLPRPRLLRMHGCMVQRTGAVRTAVPTAA